MMMFLSALIILTFYLLIGSFDKCDICHNADRLLSRKVLWSAAQREIIESYRRQHITQQFDERIKLQQNIAGTHEVDVNGRPLSALVFGDGMTAYTGMCLLLTHFVVSVEPIIVTVLYLLLNELRKHSSSTPTRSWQ
jgi:hypothetical protein